jgi:hypothetical protein
MLPFTDFQTPPLLDPLILHEIFTCNYQLLNVYVSPPVVSLNVLRTSGLARPDGNLPALYCLLQIPKTLIICCLNFSVNTQNNIKFAIP